jgi:hypothetical protein
MAEISPLRQRMIDDMTVRNLSPATQRSYIHVVAKFAKFFKRSPEKLDLEDVRAFQVYQDFLPRNPRYPYIVINDLPKVANLERILPEFYRAEPARVGG